LHSRRVFILGPSHHVYLDGCALSKCETYVTPAGDLPLDLKSKVGFAVYFNASLNILSTAIAELRATGEFSDMDIGTDEDEHSIELHLPYVRKIFEQ
jgi:predicted class III extradiol MEMO1 family dioxygenase